MLATGPGESPPKIIRPSSTGSGSQVGGLCSRRRQFHPATNGRCAMNCSRRWSAGTRQARLHFTPGVDQSRRRRGFMRRWSRGVSLKSHRHETPEEASSPSAQAPETAAMLADVKRIQGGVQVQGGFIVDLNRSATSSARRSLYPKSGIRDGDGRAVAGRARTKLHERLHQQGRLLAKPPGDNVDGTTTSFHG